MPSLIDIRRRIRSVRNTQQITKAMKMVSAAKLRRAQDRVISARPYAAILRTMLGNVAAGLADAEEGAQHALLKRRPETRIQLVLLTADRGLAGAFNANLIKASQRFIEEHGGVPIEFILLGRKGRDFWRKRNASITNEYAGIFTKSVQYSDAQAIARRVIERYTAEEVDAVYLIYNEFKSVIAQKLTLLRVLPVEVPEGRGAIEYLYEQPPEQLLESLLPRYVEMAIYGAMLESSAAEHAARMTAMDAASSNAAEVIDRLTLYMNRVRQASITKEIIEVVSGAAALE
jgi:F-type H+-transporting ATPase subunit gamma